MSENMHELSQDEFEEFIAKGLSVIDFWAPWCGPCRIMGPIFEDAAHELHGKVKFGKVNVDEEQELSESFRIMSIPTMIVFKDGKPIEKSVGVMTKDSLISKLKSFL